MARTFPPYEFHEFPKLITDKAGKRVQVMDEIEEAAALGKKFKPAEVVEIEEELPEEVAAEELSADDIEYNELLAEAEKLGVEVVEGVSLSKLRKTVSKARE